MDFDLSDPYFTEFKPGEYSSLHDPNLRNFLNKSSVRRCLTKNNLITKDGEVRCTLREFNRFQVSLDRFKSISLFKGSKKAEAGARMKI